MPDDLSRLRERLASSPGARSMNIEFIEAGEGRSVLGLEVGAAMVNSDGVCHGGFIFGLGDTAAAYACLSRHARATTQSAQITYIAPARLGERLRAEAVEVVHAKRNAVYDVRITDSSGQVVALLRGHFRLLEAKSPRA